MSLDLDQLSALFDLLASKDVAEFEHEENGVRLRVARAVAGARGAPPVAVGERVVAVRGARGAPVPRGAPPVAVFGPVAITPAAPATGIDGPPSTAYRDV